MNKKIKTKNKLIIINCNTSYSNKAMKETLKAVLKLWDAANDPFKIIRIGIY